MTDDDRIGRAARQIFEDHQAKRAFTVPSENARPRDLAEAYAVQDRLHELYLAAGHGPLAGWKIALTTPVMQQMVGVDHPCEGAIFADRVHHAFADLKHADHVNVGGEPELAVRLARDLPAEGAPYDRESVAGAVAACMAAIEIVDNRNADFADVDGALLIADNAMNVGCVLGPGVETWRGLDLAALVARMSVNGEVVGEGSGKDVLGHPLEALAWLANSLVARGRMLTAGDVVLTGSMVATRWLAPGDEMASIIDGLGEARLRIS